jgi:hypothetical protein
MRRQIKKSQVANLRQRGKINYFCGVFEKREAGAERQLSNTKLSNY